MKAVLFFLTLSFLGLSSQTSVNNVIAHNQNQAISIDFSLEDVSLADEINVDLERPSCLDQCAQYTLPCWCGGSVTYQWCPCPWFAPSAFEQGMLFCESQCGQF